MALIIGAVYEVKPEHRGVCGTFSGYSKAKSIRIKTIENSEKTGTYEILDADGNAISSCSYCFYENHLVLKTKTFMSNLIEKFRLLSKGEPEASFIKAGVQTIDGAITTEGKDLYATWRFEQDKAQFNTDVVQKLLAEESKK